ncbi:MAG: hypothetical protein II423_05820, partial [Erysipelotrichaceae bacterium]|nr:hypothetical protein [Erysipelotrichaceae bacterium]
MKRTAGILKALATITVIFEVIALVMMAMTPSLNASIRPLSISWLSLRNCYTVFILLQLRSAGPSNVTYRDFDSVFVRIEVEISIGGHQYEKIIVHIVGAV